MLFDLPGQITLETAMNNKKMKHLITGYLGNIPTNAQAIIDFCTAYGNVYIQATRKNNSKDIKFKQWIINKFRERIAIAKSEDIIRLVNKYYDTKTYLTHRVNYVIAGLMFGTKTGQHDLAKTFLKIINDTILLDRSILNNIDDRIDQKAHKMMLFMEFMFVSDRNATISNVLALSKTDNEARKILENFFEIYLIYSGIPYIMPYSEWRTIPDDIEKQMSILGQSSIGVWSTGRGLLPIPDEYIEYTTKIFHNVTAIIKKDEDIKTTFLECFYQKFYTYNKRLLAMWDEITTEPNSWIRSGGRDKVELNLKSFNTDYFKLNFLQFFIEGCDFPNVWVRFWAKVNSRLVVYEYQLDNKPLEKLPLRSHKHEVTEVLVRNFYRFIAVDCLHRIVCQPQNDQTNTNSQADTDQEKMRIVKIRKTQSEVRPHFRNLPAGHNATDDAIQFSKDFFGIKPPEGKTFVRMHNRNLDLNKEFIFS